jgi:hypothetical protein
MKKFYSCNELGHLSEVDRQIYREQYEVTVVNISSFSGFDMKETKRSEKVIFFGADRESETELKDFLMKKINQIEIGEVKLISPCRTSDAEIVSLDKPV